MILLDFRQTVLANLMMGMGKGFHDVKIDEGILRHMTLKSLKTVSLKFKNEYGQLVIADEGKRVWRRDVFPYYKANRRKSRDDSPIDWKMVFDSLDKISAEVREFMPYAYVSDDRAEADDVIGVLARESRESKTLIVSGDGDFVQLQSIPGVKQWNHVKKSWVHSADPARSLKEKIIRGDTGDGVPNFLSDDDTLVSPGKRSKPILSSRLEEWLEMEPDDICDSDEKRRNWSRNRTLLDLSMTPPDISSSVTETYSAGPKNKSRSVMLDYFVEFGLKELSADVQDF